MLYSKCLVVPTSASSWTHVFTAWGVQVTQALEQRGPGGPLELGTEVGNVVALRGGG